MASSRLLAHPTALVAECASEFPKIVYSGVRIRRQVNGRRAV